MDNMLNNQKDLKNQVNKNTNDIKELKSNVKWIYQYGGVGGSGNGAGSGQSSTWSIYATIDGQLIQDNKQIILNNNSKHTLVISISKPSGLSYTIDYIKRNGNINPDKINKKLSIGNYEYVYNNINIIGNNEFSIKVTCDEDNEPKEINCMLITNPISVSAVFQEYKDGTYKNISNKDSIFVSQINELYISLDYSIYTNGSSILVCTNNNLQIEGFPENGQLLLDNSFGTLRFKILDFKNSIYYGINNINLYLDINNGQEQIDLSTSCTFIPDGMFLRMSPFYNSNSLYNSIDYLSLNRTFNTGVLYFNLTGYNGTPNARVFNISCIKTKIGSLENEQILIDDNYVLPIAQDFFNSSSSKIIDTSKNSLNINFLSELTTTKAYINIGDSGIYALNFMMTYEENGIITTLENPFTYYIVVQSSQNSAQWIENIELDQLSQIVDGSGKKMNTLSAFSGSISSEYSFYYRPGETSNNIINQLRKYGSHIDISNNISEDINLINITPIGNANEQYIINIGIQYSDINDISKPILTLYGSNREHDIIIYQDKIHLVNKNDKTYNIYIPKENAYDTNDLTKYHLLTIVRQRMNDTSNCYSFVFYIDGIQEIAVDGTWMTGIAYTGIILHKSNYAINLIDVTNIVHKLEYNNVIYELELRDHIISEYYMKYASNIYGNNISSQLQISLDSLNISKKFVFEDNVIKVQDGISTLIQLKKSLSNTAMMMFDLSDNYDKSRFFDEFFFPDASSVKKSLQFKKLYYDNFEGEGIVIPDSDCHWSIEHQGSSTLGYKIKNLELRSVSTASDDNATTYIFSPNFKNITNDMSEDEKNDIYATSFLPESSFTLKADMMDSSHCNNTSIGLFVNKNTVKFEDALNQENVSNSIYKNYVKNCLSGYPCMLFIQVKNNITNENEVYYLGIYNFNLGRESSFNLAYNDIKILDNIRAYNFETKENYDNNNKGLRDGFNIYNITKSAINQQKKNICIAEIQGNDSRFDFSQYDPSILFNQDEQGSNDKTYMLGDIVPKYNNPIDKGNQKNLLSKFIKSIAYAGGFIFDTLHKGMSNDINDEYGYGEGYGYKTSIPGYPHLSMNMVPNYRMQSKRTIVGNINKYTYEEKQKAVEKDLVNAICTITDEYSNIINYPSIDYRSLVEYYVICMAFGMVDSVQKNLNIKSWTANRELGAKFYAAFYDMDTSNGKTNSGGKTNKYAFSDYWVTLHNNSSYLEQSNIFRDFYPSISAEGSNIKTGYDTPSSYLFAIAKYASLFDKKELIDLIDTATLGIYPENLWAYYRRSKGELRNAKYFIDNYFYKNINNIPIQFIALNYRFKYLQLSGTNKNYTQYDTSTLEKFSGLGKNYAQDWLNDRFHILDAYFNLQQENKPVYAYDYDKLSTANIDNMTSLNDVINPVEFKTVTLDYNSNYDSPFGYEVDSSNPDIYVINHIFNSSPSTHIKGIMKPFNISALEMSPLIVKTTNNEIAGSYVIPKDNQMYNININKESNENWLFGGSQLWTRINNILPFIGEESGFYINSSKIRSINGNRGVCSSWTILCPSLQTLSLTNNKDFSGTLTISEGNNWQSIKDINISNTKIALNCSNVNVTNINCDNVSNDSSIIINNCQLLNNVSFNNLSANKLQLTPIHIQNLSIIGCNIKELEISPKFEKTTINIDNIENIETINITVSNSNGNINKLIINRCKKIKYIIINEEFTNTIEYLDITNCDLSNLQNDSDKLIYIEENADERILHLEKLTNLKYVLFDGTLGFDVVIFPDREKITLLPRAFANTNLAHIRFDGENKNHKLELTSNDSGDCHIFFNSRYTPTYSILDPHILVNYTFIVEKENTSLKSLFEIGKYNNSNNSHKPISQITYGSAESILRKLEGKNNVCNLDRLFMRQTEMNYSDYSMRGYKISLSDFNNVESCEEIFWGTNVKVLDNILFGENFGKNINKLNILNIMSSILYMHKDSLQYIKNKIDSFAYSIDKNDDNGMPYYNYLSHILIYDNNGINETVNVHDLFYSENNSETYITTICGINIINNQTDFMNLFTNNENKVSNIVNSFNNLFQFNRTVPTLSTYAINLNNIGLDKISSNLTLYNSFRGSNNNKITNVDEFESYINNFVDIINFIDYNRQYKNINNNLSKFNNKNVHYNIFQNLYKKCDTTKNNWNNGWETLWNSLANSNITPKYTFDNTIFIFDEIDNITIPQTSSPITNLYSTFSNCTGYKNGIECGIKIDNIFENLQSLEYAQMLFNGSTFNAINEYPIPNNFLPSSIKNIEYMFYNTKAIGDKVTCDKVSERKTIIYNTNDFKSKIYTNSSIYNDACPIINPNLFNNLTNLESISFIFANSFIEGYMPCNMFDTCAKLTNIENMFTNCNVFSQQYITLDRNINTEYIYNIETNNNYDTYIMFPEDFIDFSKNRISNIKGIFNVNTTISTNSGIRTYLLSNKTFKSINNDIELDNFNSIISKDSKILAHYEYDSALGNYKFIETNSDAKFNLCINKYDNYISEGLPKEYFALVSDSNKYIFDKEIAEIYYGYILEYSIVINNKNILSKDNIPLLLKTINILSVDGTNTTIYPSKHIIWPTIIKYNNVNSQDYPDQGKYIDMPINTIVNPSYKDGILQRSNNIKLNINSNMINYYYTSYNTESNNNSHIVKYYNNDDLILEINIIKDIITNNDIVEEFKKYVKYNYLLLLNNWYIEYSNIQDKDSDNPYVILKTYNNITIDDGDFLITDNYNNILLTNYYVYIKRNSENDVYKVKEITKNKQ